MVKRNYLSDTAPIFGDPIQIEQIIRNLVVNAAQAMELSSKKELTIGVRRSKRRVYVTIQDTGHGIPKSKIEEIFQPFYTTKPDGKGTGLGLAIVRAMLKRHQACVEVDSEEGVGTIFQLQFPIYDAKVAGPQTIPIHA